MAGLRRASGSLFGMAYGDALGKDTEFITVEQIKRQFPPDGPRKLYGHPALVTDDTQMALAVGEALLAAPKPYTREGVEKELRQTFVEWLNDPENNRAPGNTCLAACRNLERGLPWHKATVANSKGCGANMRVQPVGLLRDITEETRAALAQFQAALTHGHPTGLAASDLTAKTIALLIAGEKPADLPRLLREYAESQRRVYHADWLESLWERGEYGSPEAFIESGWTECLETLNKLDEALPRQDRETDPCVYTGDGWKAEDAFGTGLLCFLLFPEDPVGAIHRGAVTRGDSDSIACLAGSFAGAYLGLEVWPAAWLEQIEYRERLDRLGQTWD